MNLWCMMQCESQKPSSVAQSCVCAGIDKEWQDKVKAASKP